MKNFLFCLIVCIAAVAASADYTPYSTDMYGLENQVYNADFDRPIADPTIFWSVSINDPTYILIDYTDSAGDGNACLRMNANELFVGTSFWARPKSRGGKFHYDIPVEPNDIIICNYKYKSSADADIPAGDVTVFQLLQFDDTNYTGLLAQNILTLTNDQWVSDTIMAIVPESPGFDFVSPNMYVGAETALRQGNWKFDEIECYVLPQTSFDTLAYMGDDWLSNESLAPLPDILISDFEEYVPAPGGPNVPQYWLPYSAAAQDKGNPQVSYAIDPVEGDDCLRFDYDQTGSFAGNAQWNEISAVFNEGAAGGIDISNYDELRMKIYRPAGNSLENNFYIKLYINDWTGDVHAFSNVNAAPIEYLPAVADPQLTTQTPVGVWDEWVIDLHKIRVNADLRTIETMTECTGMMFGVSSSTNKTGGEFGTGTLYIDDVKFVQTKPDCSASVSGADLNGDCEVNLVDTALLAHTWLRSPLP